MTGWGGWAKKLKVTQKEKIKVLTRRTLVQLDQPVSFNQEGGNEALAIFEVLVPLDRQF